MAFYRSKCASIGVVLALLLAGCAARPVSVAPGIAAAPAAASGD